MESQFNPQTMTTPELEAYLTGVLDEEKMGVYGGSGQQSRAIAVETELQRRKQIGERGMEVIANYCPTAIETLSIPAYEAITAIFDQYGESHRKEVIAELRGIAEAATKDADWLEYPPRKINMNGGAV